MALDNKVQKTVQAGVHVMRTADGIVAKKDGDNTDTVYLPPHVAKFFEDKGLVA